MFDFQALSILFLIIILCLLWYENLRVRESVTRTCRRVCEEAGLQLLDDTVALVGMSPGRRRGGGYRLIRIYRFELSADGHERRFGYITLNGSTIESIRIEGTDGVMTIEPSPVRLIH